MQRKTMKQSLSFLLALVMLVSLLTVPVGAAETAPGKTPVEMAEEITKNCSAVILQDGKERTEAFRENETSVDVKVQLDPSVKQCYLTIYSYASNTAFDPSGSHNIILGSQFVKNGDEVTIQFRENTLPLKVGYSVIACLNVPVGPDWYLPVNSQALKIVDENGQGFEDYDPYPNAYINEKSLEAGATSMHISLEADPRLFQAAKEKKTSLNVAVRQYPAGADFDFEAEDQITVYNAFSVTEPIENQEITLTEPLKPGYRVRAVVYWEQNVELHLVKGNDYEAVFHRPDDSVLIPGEIPAPEEKVSVSIVGAVNTASESVTVQTAGKFPAGARVIVKAFPAGTGNADMVLAGGTQIGAADAASTVTVKPLENPLAAGEKLVAFLAGSGKVLAQSAPVTVSKDVPSSGEGSIVLNEAITVDTKSATITVTGCDEFKGGRLILTIGDSVYDDRQLANVAFTGAGTYTVDISSAYELRKGEKLLPYLFLGSSSPAKYFPGTISVVGGDAPAPEEEDKVTLAGPITTDTKTATVTVTGCEEFQGGLLILTTGPASQKDADSRMQIASVPFTGANTYTLKIRDGVTLKNGETVLVHLYKYDSDADRTAYKYGNQVAITGGDAPAPVELSVAIDGAVTVDSKTIAVRTAGTIPADSMVLVKAFDANEAIALDKGTPVAVPVAAAAQITVTPKAGMLQAGEKLVAFLMKGGEVLAQSEAVTVTGAVTPPVGNAAVTITDKVVTKGDNKVNGSAVWDKQLGEEARYALYQFAGETLNKETAVKLSEGKLYRASSSMTMYVQDRLVVGQKLQVVLTIGGREVLSNIVTVEPSPDWGTPTVALGCAYVSGDAKSIPVTVQYDKRYLTMGKEFYCDVTLYQFPGTITEEEFVEKELWENSSIATRIGQVNSVRGDQTLGELTVPVLKTVQLVPGSRIIAKLRLPHTEWEGEEVDYVSLTVPVLKAGETQPDPVVALLNLGEDTEKGQQLRAILQELGIAAKTLTNKDLDELVGYVAGLPGYEETPGDFTDHHYTTEFMLMANLSETQLDQLLAAMQKADLFIGHKAMVVEGNKNLAVHELLELIVDEHNEMMQLKLQELVKKAKALDEKTYGERADWDKLQASIGKAEALLKQEKPSTEDLEAAVKELQGLYDSVVDGKTPDPEKPDPKPEKPSHKPGHSSDHSYRVVIEDCAHGEITSRPRTAEKGDKVTLTITPAAGYALYTLEVTDRRGGSVDVRIKGGEATFTMPGSQVTVAAEFRKDGSARMPFYDVSVDDYFAEPVLWAVKEGITSGRSAHMFAPYAGCTRAQAVTFLWRAAGSPAPASRVNPFTDVAAGSYYEDAVLWAVEQGITNGKTATVFAPDAICTRAQIVTFLWRAEGSKVSGTVSSFADVPAGAYYAEAVQWAAENGVTAGKTESVFAPDETCTRAQIVTFLYRAMK